MQSEHIYALRALPSGLLRICTRLAAHLTPNPPLPLAEETLTTDIKQVQANLNAMRLHADSLQARGKELRSHIASTRAAIEMAHDQLAEALPANGRVLWRRSADAQLSSSACRQPSPPTCAIFNTEATRDERRTVRWTRSSLAVAHIRCLRQPPRFDGCTWSAWLPRNPDPVAVRERALPPHLGGRPQLIAPRLAKCVQS